MTRTASPIVPSRALLTVFALAAALTVAAPASRADAATVQVDLYAVTGHTHLPGRSSWLPVWGYTDDGTAAAAPGGPTLYANAGDTVTVTLHNELSEATGLLFQGQDMVPDRTGTAAGDQAEYTFTATRPGTYLYEAGLLPNAQHQVAMGLYGALVVRPATAGQAYDDPATAFDSETVIVLGEVDPRLNTAANKARFDLRRFQPQWYLINGTAHPRNEPIPAASGDTVLLRYVNAGLNYHSIALLGAHQTVVALDGSPLDTGRRYVADTFGPGQTADALVVAPTTDTDRRLAVFDASMSLHNQTASGLGGAMATIDVAGAGATSSDDAGPVASLARYTAGTLRARIDDRATGRSIVAAAEFYIDSLAAAPTPMTPVRTGFDHRVELVEAPLPLPNGQHVVYVRGQDAAGNWGDVTSVLLVGDDVVGPATPALTLDPALTNGVDTAVSVSATGDDTATGGSDVIGGEYFVDAVGADGTGATLTAGTVASVASLTGELSAADVAGLSQGTHVVSAHSQDAAGNWGPMTTADLVVDATGPSTSNVTVAPNPNNGTLPINGTTPAVRVTATLTDPTADGVQSAIAAAEAFLGTEGADGSGIPLVPSDGTFNTSLENGYADIPLTTVQSLSDGSHTIWVHAKDAAGNWGATASTTLLVDKVQPTVSALSVTPDPTAGATSVAVSATAADGATDVVAAEAFVDTDPGVGAGTALAVSGAGPWDVAGSLDVTGLDAGAHTVRVRVRDAAGNWSTAGTVPLTVSGP